jgi:exodeoxyribonuclease-1
VVAAVSADSFLWHDYETFGRDPARERPAQFAAIRTDLNLEPTGDTTMIYCRQSADYLPDPESCLVHGVLPQTANEQGLSEWEFANTINALMAQAGTCTVGYNNIRFDDEFSRQLFFRNLMDPYAREWQNGNSRWDLIDVVRLARALRPEGIEWPATEDGKPSNKLELLTEANGISHSNAHDALADVYATIAIAKLLKEKQPRLYDFAFSIKNKRAIFAHLSVVTRPAMLHVSGMYPSETGNISIVMPLGAHPGNQNGILVYDLRHAPTDLIKLNKEEIAARLFTRQADLPEGQQRIAVKTVHANRCPVIAPLKTMTTEAAKRLKLDVNLALQYREQLIANPQVIEKLAWAFAARDYPNATDPELTLYSGTFASDKDRHTMQQVQSSLQSGRADTAFSFDDDRLNEIWLRLRARHNPDTLSAQDQSRWQAFCRQRVHTGIDGFRTINDYEESMIKLKASISGEQSTELIGKLQAYGKQVAAYTESV